MGLLTGGRAVWSRARRISRNSCPLFRENVPSYSACGLAFGPRMKGIPFLVRGWAQPGLFSGLGCLVALAWPRGIDALSAGVAVLLAAEAPAAAAAGSSRWGLSRGLGVGVQRAQRTGGTCWRPLRGRLWGHFPATYEVAPLVQVGLGQPRAGRHRGRDIRPEAAAVRGRGDGEQGFAVLGAGEVLSAHLLLLEEAPNGEHSGPRGCT